jgi:hypothetical protein
MSTGRPSHAEEFVRIEVGIDAADAEPNVESDTRIDILVESEAYPTARLNDGRYVAWWFDTEAPAPAEPAASEWVAAPTRFLAAGTLHELWEDPAAFDRLTAQG